MKLLKSIKNLNLDHSQKYLLACSFGPDSMALANMLFNQEYMFSVAHVNYKTRTNSDYEEKEMIKWCEKRNIKCFVKIVKIEDSTDFENKARIARYDFFSTIYIEGGFDCLLTAHNADDSIETFFMNKKRCSLSEYYGILPSTIINNMRVERPLLCYEKAKLTEFCSENEYPYSIDYTNMELIHTRNKIRNEIISKLSFEEKYSLIESFDKENRILKSLYEKYSNIKLNDEISNCIFQTLSEMEIKRVFHKIVSNIFSKSISTALIDQITSDVNSKLKNIVYNLGDGQLIILEYNCLRCVRTLDITFKYRIPKEKAIDIFDIDVKFVKEHNDFYVVPLTTFSNVVIDGHKKTIRRLLIDFKMPVTFRDLWPCIIDENDNIIYYPRYRENNDNSKRNIMNFSVKSLLNLAIWE